MKYKVINSDLFLNGQLISEGSTIELTSEQTEGITAYLQPLKYKSEPKENKSQNKKPVPNSVRDQK